MSKTAIKFVTNPTTSLNRATHTTPLNPTTPATRSKRTPPNPTTQTPRTPRTNTTVRVQVCRGCCCGTVRKHPETDHEGQLKAISTVARTRVVKCVGECAYSNVIIVRPGNGAESIWLGGINDAELTDAVCEWLTDGASQPPPPVIQSKVFVRSTRAVGAGSENV